MDIISLLNDYGVRYQTEGHKHCRAGWANMECPFCEGNPGLHLGVTLNGDRFYCWRCGWKSSLMVLSKLMGCREGEVKNILYSYGGSVGSKIKLTQKDKKPFKIPEMVSKCTERHKKYLEKRGYDPDKIISLWGVMGTGPVSYLDGINYSHRLFIPIYWNEKLISFQTRDITEKSKYKYLSCPQDREIKDHKTILYGKWNRWNNIGILVEGVFDVWRFGEFSYATFGIQWDSKMIKNLVERFSRIFICFDSDSQAQKQAQKLKTILEQYNIETQIIKIEGDPGDMFQKDADYLVKQLVKN